MGSCKTRLLGMSSPVDSYGALQTGHTCQKVPSIHTCTYTPSHTRVDSSVGRGKTGRIHARVRRSVAHRPSQPFLIRRSCDIKTWFSSCSAKSEALSSWASLHTGDRQPQLSRCRQCTRAFKPRPVLTHTRRAHHPLGAGGSMLPVQVIGCSALRTVGEEWFVFSLCSSASPASPASMAGRLCS